jgi:hypothetical protein
MQLEQKGWGRQDTFELGGERSGMFLCIHHVDLSIFDVFFNSSLRISHSSFHRDNLVVVVLLAIGDAYVANWHLKPKRNSTSG